GLTRLAFHLADDRANSVLRDAGIPVRVGRVLPKWLHSPGDSIHLEQVCLYDSLGDDAQQIACADQAWFAAPALKLLRGSVELERVGAKTVSADLSNPESLARLQETLQGSRSEDGSGGASAPPQTEREPSGR